MFYSLLTAKQHKLDKGRARKWATCGVQLAPANDAGLGTVCAMAGYCKHGCIKLTGRNRVPAFHDARVRRTEMFKTEREQFYQLLQLEIMHWQYMQAREGFKLAIRPNVLSDLPELGHRLARMFPTLQVYDYTKLRRPAERVLSNYHLTYSYSERTRPEDIQHCIEHRINVAVIVDLEDGRLPKTITLHGERLPVVDGDKTDLRFLDPSHRTHAVALRWKQTTDNAAKLDGARKAGLVIAA